MGWNALKWLSGMAVVGRQEWLAIRCVSMVLALLWGFIAQAAPPLYTVTDLGSLGGNASYANGINNSGQVVGSFDLAGEPEHAFLYSSGKMNDLGEGSARAINNSGQVVGMSSQGGFLYSEGVMSSVDTMFSIVMGINNSGQFVGSTSFHQVYSSNEGLIIPNVISYASGINDSGQIVGMCEFYRGEFNFQKHAFLYSGGVLTDLGSLGGDSMATAINNNGQIVGESNLGGSDHAFLFSGGVMGDLGTLGGNDSNAISLNARGQVVGSSSLTGDHARHAFLYSEGVMTDLNTLLASNATGWVLNVATAINDAGQIAGSGTINGQTHAFLLTPVTFVQPGTSPGSQSLGSLGNLNLTGIGTALASNYMITQGLSTITLYEILTVSAIRPYDGSFLFNTNSGTLGAATFATVNGLNVGTVAGTTGATVASPLPGTYALGSLGNLTLNGIGITGGTGTITPKLITVSATRQYDGSVLFNTNSGTPGAATFATVNGANGDQLTVGTVAGTTGATVASPQAGVYTMGSLGNLYLTGIGSALASNYQIVAGTGTITPVPILDPLCTAQSTCDGSPFISQQNGLTQDPATLMQATVQRDGVVTDGVTRLLLRIPSDSPVTFTLQPDDGSTPKEQTACLWGRLESLDGSTGSCNTLTVQPQNVPNVGNVVFAVFLAPDGVPQGATPQVSRKVTVQAAIGSATTSQTLSLQAPPVVLIHGVWSSPTAWTKPIQGLDKGFKDSLTDLGFDVYLVDHSWIMQSASSFDPYDSNAQVLVLVDSWVQTAKNNVRLKGSHGLAISQVDVVGHSMGGLIARARTVAKNVADYSRADNGWNGDFHKLITIGTPHRGTALADTLIVNNCALLSVLDGSHCLPSPEGCIPVQKSITLQDFFSGILKKPLGPAVLGFQTGSLPIQHIGATAVPSSAIVGIAPATSTTETLLNDIMSWYSVGATVDGLLGGIGNHDTIEPVTSQMGGIPNSATAQITGIVHASLWGSNVGETQSIDVFNQVQALLLASAGSEAFDITGFDGLGSGGTYNSLQQCRAQAAIAPAAKATAAAQPSFTMLPASGTVVSPGQVVNLTFNVTGGVPAGQGMFSLNGALYPMSGPPPYTLPFTVPTGRAGVIKVAAFAFGSQNYAAATSLTVLPTQAQTQLTATPSSLNLTLQGSSLPLTVTGSYAGGSQIDLTAAEAGTTYATRSGNNKILSVSTAGIVTANATGQDTVVVSNSGLTATVPITVNITNHAPVVQIQGGTSLTMIAGSSTTLAVTATDQEGNTMALSLLDTPAFASLKDQGGGKGSLGLNPLPPDVGLHNFYVYALDNGTPPLGVTTAMQVQVQANPSSINQTISFGSAPTVVVGGTGTVSATGGASGNPVVFTSQTTGVCTISGSTVTGVSAGNCTIAANQAGNSNYNAAAQATQSFDIGMGSQTISFSLAPTVAVGGTGTLSATNGASGDPVTYTSLTTNVCTVSGNTVTGVALGTCTIAANQAGNANYNAAPQATQIFSVSGFALTVSNASGSVGTVSSNVGGIACGALCSASFASGTAVTLTAIPVSGYQFTGWGGACRGYGNSCTVTMNPAQTVTANFAVFKVHQSAWKRAIGSIVKGNG